MHVLQLALLALVAVVVTAGEHGHPKLFRKFHLGAILPKFRKPGITAVGDEYLKYLDIPTHFDSREQWPECESLKEIRDQGQCGSCVLHATAGAMTDRYCIHSNGKQKFHFSSEHLLSCVSDEYLCMTGTTANGGWDFYQRNGVVSGGEYHSNEGCQPLESITGGLVTCHTQCTNSKYNVAFNDDLRFCNQPQYLATPAAAQREILTNGPVTAAFDVYEDFWDFGPNEIYEHKYGAMVGGHEIRIIGWGEENGKDYWLIANSWGNYWGDNGFFKMARGKNECNLEQYIMGAIPIYP